MSNPLLKGSVEHDLADLNESLQQYADRTKKAPVDVLLKKGLDLSIQLYRAYASLTPKAGAITAAGKARGYRVKVRGKALMTAAAMLEGDPSANFIVSRLPDGRVKIVRQSGTKITRKMQKQLGIGGKTAREMKAKLGVRRLNLRAAATALELSFRERGRRVLGVSWLYRRWRELKTKRTLVNNSPRSLVTFGSASLYGQQTATGPQGVLALRSVVDGVASVGQKRGVVRQALMTVRNDIALYMLRKQTEDLRNAVRRMKRPIAAAEIS